MTFTIYRHTHRASGKCYVGQTIKTMAARWYIHVYEARRGAGCRALAAAIRKYGPDAFDHEVLEEVDTREEANEAETRWIRKLNCRAPNGYNLDGGGGVREVHEETKQRIREAWTPERRAAHGARISASLERWWSGLTPAARVERARLLGAKQQWTPARRAAQGAASRRAAATRRGARSVAILNALRDA